MMAPIIRALIVEDDAAWQQILEEILTDAGLVVDLANNLEQALHYIKTEPHRLAILDLSLAAEDHHNYDGLRVLEAVRRLDPGCQAILLTGYATVELAVSVLTEYGAFNFLRKESFQRLQFTDLIARALLNAPYLDGSTISTVLPEPVIDPEAEPVKAPLAKKALVVEDDAGWRSILAELLSDAGFEVRLSASFGEALGNLRREKYALAVVDLSLSNGVVWGSNMGSGPLEGYQLLAETKINYIPSIVVSGMSSMDEIQRVYKEYSIFAFLEKQAFDRNTFIRLVGEASLSNPTISELESLTDREREVFALLSSGMTNKEIAARLVISTNTVKRHIKAIYEKLKVHTRSGAAAKSVSQN